MKWFSSLALLVMALLLLLPAGMKHFFPFHSSTFLRLPPASKDSTWPSPFLDLDDSLTFEAGPFEIQYVHGLRPVYDPDSNRVGFQDSVGKWKIAPRFLEAHPFSENLAGVCLGDIEEPYCGFIDTLGAWQIDPQFPRILHGFHQGFATVALPGLVEAPFAYIDSSGGLRISLVFSNAQPFQNGEAWVQCGPETALGRAYTWGKIDSSGFWKLECEKRQPN